MLPLAFTESMATRAAARRVWTCDSRSRKEKVRVKDLEKIAEEDMAGKLTGGLGVGVGELAADDDLIRLSPVKVTASLGELVEEVVDVVLSTLIQDLEVGRELDGGVSADMRSDGDLKCSNDRKGECFTRSGDKAAGSIGGTLAGALVAGHLFW